MYLYCSYTTCRYHFCTPWRCNANGERLIWLFWYKYYGYIQMIIFYVEVDDYFCTITGLSRQCRCWICKRHFIFSIKWSTNQTWELIFRKTNSKAAKQPEYIFLYGKTISPEMILRLEKHFCWTKRSLRHFEDEILELIVMVAWCLWFSRNECSQGRARLQSSVIV